jgi:hypothetical protein
MSGVSPKLTGLITPDLGDVRKMKSFLVDFVGPGRHPIVGQRLERDMKTIHKRAAALAMALSALALLP